MYAFSSIHWQPSPLNSCMQRKFGGMLCKFFFSPYQKMRNTFADMIKAILNITFCRTLKFFILIWILPLAFDFCHPGLKPLIFYNHSCPHLKVADNDSFLVLSIWLFNDVIRFLGWQDLSKYELNENIRIFNEEKTIDNKKPRGGVNL